MHTSNFQLRFFLNIKFFLENSETPSLVIHQVHWNCPLAHLKQNVVLKGNGWWKKFYRTRIRLKIYFGDWRKKNQPLWIHGTAGVMNFNVLYNWPWPKKSCYYAINHSFFTIYEWNDETTFCTLALKGLVSWT